MKEMYKAGGGIPFEDTDDGESVLDIAEISKLGVE